MAEWLAAHRVLPACAGDYDLANLPEIVRLKNEYDSRLFVDDAHGVGVFGESGRGTAEHFGVEDEVDLVMGTFSKSLATVGGFIAASSSVIDYIRHHARSGIFSAAASTFSTGTSESFSAATSRTAQVILEAFWSGR